MAFKIVIELNSRCVFTARVDGVKNSTVQGESILSVAKKMDAKITQVLNSEVNPENEEIHKLFGGVISQKDLVSNEFFESITVNCNGFEYKFTNHAIKRYISRFKVNRTYVDEHLKIILNDLVEFSRPRRSMIMSILNNNFKTARFFACKHRNVILVFNDTLTTIITVYKISDSPWFSDAKTLNFKLRDRKNNFINYI